MSAELSEIVQPTLASGTGAIVATKRRTDALDLMRGLVMVLMAVDHSSEEFNRGRLFTDSAFMFHPGAQLPAAQFFLRWVTHLCAPTFVFLAGTSLALTVSRRVAAGETAFAIDRYLLVRGLIIAGFELWVSWFWMQPGHYLFQVLYAIGSSYLFMIPLRRLPTPLLVAVALAIVFFDEAIIGIAGWASGSVPVAAGLLFVPNDFGRLIVAYPTLPWLAQMLLGWAFGRYLLQKPARSSIQRRLCLGGVAALAFFLVVRGENGYGNMRLLREGFSAVQWLHVSKYPPSATYVALELGLCFLFLAAFYAVPDGSLRANNLVLSLGRTPMFFYLVHIPVLAETGRLLHLTHTGGIGLALLFAALVVLLLYGPCVAYGRYKARNPQSLARYI